MFGEKQCQKTGWWLGGKFKLIFRLLLELQYLRLVKKQKTDRVNPAVFVDDFLFVTIGNVK